MAVYRTVAVNASRASLKLGSACGQRRCASGTGLCSRFNGLRKSSNYCVTELLDLIACQEI